MEMTDLSYSGVEYDCERVGVSATIGLVGVQLFKTLGLRVLTSIK